MAFWFTLILFVATFVLSELLRPKPDLEDARPADLGDFNFPTATQGRIVPLIWGTVKLSAPNVVWYGDLIQEPIKEEVKTGMWSKETFIKGYRYYVGIQMGLCRGPVDKLLRIWVGDDEVWNTGLTGPGSFYLNLPELFGGDDLGNGGLYGNVSFYTGSETQAASSYLSNHQSEGGVTPAYRGTCYTVLEGGYLGNSTTIKPWRYELQRIPNGLGLGTPQVNTLDANPANVIYELLTNSEWGLGFPASDIDVTNFTNVANTLRTEGNGFSMVLDNPVEISGFLAELERQIDGVVVLNRSTGKWQINLTRGGYDIDTIPQATPNNVIEIRDFSRGAWDETANEVRVHFFQRANEYTEDYAMSQDSANIKIQGVCVASTVNYPGCKDADLANNLAWRDLRTLSRPLAKATLVVNREFYDINPGDVIAWTEPSLEFTKLAMRVTKVDLGSSRDGKIVLNLVEDVFTFEQPSFESPQLTKWVPPSDTMVDIPAASRIFFEAPKAISDRDPSYPGLARRFWFGALSQGDGAVMIELEEAGIIVGTVMGFLVAAKLNSALAQGAQGTVDVELICDPTSKAQILNKIITVTDDDIGTLLSNVVLINNEFIGFESVTDLGTNIRINNIFRGLMDSAIAAHGANDRVWFLSVSGNITVSSFSAASVTFKPIPKSRFDRLNSASATSSIVSIANRHLKPYPPVNLQLNSSLYPSSVSLDVNVGATDGGKGIQMDYVRRDYRTTHEVNAVLNENSLPSDFPTTNNTRYQIEVRNDPGGSNTLLYTIIYQNGNQVDLSRTEILRYTNGAIPSTMRLVIKTRHTVTSVDYNSVQDHSFDFSTTSSELSGRHNFQALNDGVTSNQWSAPETGTYAFSIQQNVITGTNAVQARINSGTWQDIITAGNTSGNLTGVTLGDTVEVRHTENSSNTNQTLLVVNPPTSSGAYAVLII